MILSGRIGRVFQKGSVRQSTTIIARRKSKNGAQPVRCGCATVDLSEIFFEPVFEPVDVVVTCLNGFFGQKRVEQGDGGVDTVDD